MLQVFAVILGAVTAFFLLAIGCVFLGFVGLCGFVVGSLFTGGTMFGGVVGAFIAIGAALVLFAANFA